MLSRKERVVQVRDRVSKGWCQYWWSFMMEFDDKLDWDELSMNPNVSPELIRENPDKAWNWNLTASHSFPLLLIYRGLPAFRWRDRWCKLLLFF